MTQAFGSKACTNCAKSRRKCGKQRPQCLRCRTRGLHCTFPPTRPSCFVPLLEDTTSTADTENLQFALQLHNQPSIGLSFVDDRLTTWWFASPETWTIDSPQISIACRKTTFSSTDLDHLLEKVFEWLTEWVDTGSNPFIHRQLYQTCFPTAIQDAYLALSAYLNKTPRNKDMVHRIIEERVIRLVASGVCTSSNLNSTRDTLDTLSRAQALFVYQCIGIHDGDIRLRHLAEQHVTVLYEWMTVLMQQTQQTLCSSIPAFSSPSSELRYFTSLPEVVDPENHLWYSWILAESSRRLWLVIASMQGMYQVVSRSPNDNSTIPCRGAPIFTSRKGFWEAENAMVWEHRCTEHYAGLLRVTETEKMFTMVPRKEINEFAKLVFECTFGVEWCERWGI